MNSNPTETESNVAKIIKCILLDNQHIEEKTIDLLNNLKIQSYNFGNNIPKAITISVDKSLLIYIKLCYSKIILELKKTFVNNMILFIENEEIIPIKGHNPNRKRESVIKSLVFPSVLIGRVSDVQSENEITQEVLLDAKHQSWSSAELKTLRKIMTDLFKADFRIKYFAFPKILNE